MAETTRTLAGYLDDVASGAPTPGGGSVAAIAGALAAALGNMVVNLSLDRARDDHVAATLEQSARRLGVLRATLYGTARRDEEAYAAYHAAAALPRREPGEKRARAQAMQQALIAASDVPLAIAQATTETAELLIGVARLGNPRLRADAALSALLAEAALRGALLLLRGNASMLDDRARAESYLANAAELERRGRAAAELAYRTAADGR